MIAHSYSPHLGLSVLCGGEVFILQAVRNEDVVKAVYTPRSGEDSFIRVVDPPGIGHTQVPCPCKQSAVARNVNRRRGAGIESRVEWRRGELQNGCSKIPICKPG